jgi:cob(I)alamin adenosyltransferase
MVKLTRIYTKGGDKGETSLGSGARVPKHDRRVTAYGTVDEANATIGLARLHTKGKTDQMLARIQNDLFDLGADLCVPEEKRAGKGKSGAGALRVDAAQTLRLEREIDAMNSHLAPLNSFILPGGSAASAYLHLARTVVRRAERVITALAETEAVNPEAVRYINRLSDHLVVLARWLNRKGRADRLWVPGANR